MTQRIDYQKLSTPGLRALGGVYTYIVNSGLPKVLIDLVFLRASQINGCAYCIDMHSRDTPSRPDCLSSTSSSSPHGPSPAAIFDDQERAALAWAEVVTRLRGRTSQQTSAPVGFWNRGAAARFQRERHRVCLIHH